MMIESPRESLYCRQWHKVKMGGMLDYVAVMLVRCKLSNNHTLAWQPIWGGGVPWCRHVDVTTSI